MAAKIDKETLIKNRFWISVPVALLFILIAFFLVLGVRSTTLANWNNAKTVDKDLKQLQSKGPDLRNDRWVQRMKEEMEKAQGQKTELWIEVYDRQNGTIREAPPKPAAADPNQPAATADAAKGSPAPGKLVGLKTPLITWQDEMHNQAVLNWPPSWQTLSLRMRNFGEPLGNLPQAEYRRDFMKQYQELIKLVDFLDEEAMPGTDRVGSVRVAAGIGQEKSSRKNALYLLNPPRYADRAINDYEAWLAQEDIAIRRELLIALNEANDSVALMQPEWRSVALPDPNASAEIKPEEVNPMPMAETPPAEPPADGSEPKPPPLKPGVLDHKRFLNSTWQIGVVQPDAEKRPALNWWDGWLLEMQLVSKGNEVVLEATSGNLSDKVALPAMDKGGKVVVWISNGEEQNRQAFRISPYELDAGDLPPTKHDGTGKMLEFDKKPLKEIAGVSKKDFKIPVFQGAKKIVRVQRSWDKSVLDHQRFVNPNWLVDLKLMPRQEGKAPSVEPTIYNRSGRRLMPANFEVVYTTDGRDEVRMTPDLKVTGDAFNAWTSRSIDRQAVGGTNPPKQLVRVRQIVDWQTVPIKEIRAMKVGAEAHIHSDRTKVIPLETYKFDKKNPQATPAAAAPAPDPAAPTGPGIGEGGGMGRPGMPGSGGAGSGAVSPHGIPLRRYYEVTDELRRLPVALVLVVEAERVNDILVAFANSRIRFRTTMAPWSRLTPPLAEPVFINQLPSRPAGGGAPGAPGSPPSNPPSGFPPQGKPGGVGPGALPGAGSGSQPPLPGFPGSGNPMNPSGGRPNARPLSTPPRDETIQVELQVYGLITLYESPDAFKRIQAAKAAAPSSPPVAGQ